MNNKKLIVALCLTASIAQASFLGGLRRVVAGISSKARRTFSATTRFNWKNADEFSKEIEFESALDQGLFGYAAKIVEKGGYKPNKHQIWPLITLNKENIPFKEYERALKAALASTNINQQGDYSRDTLLMSACMFKNQEAIVEILKHNPDLSITGDKKQTVLHQTAKAAQNPITNQLLDHIEATGVTPQISGDRAGYTPLHYLAEEYDPCPSLLAKFARMFPRTIVTKNRAGEKPGDILYKEGNSEILTQLGWSTSK